MPVLIFPEFIGPDLSNEINAIRINVKPVSFHMVDTINEILLGRIHVHPGPL